MTFEESILPEGCRESLRRNVRLDAYTTLRVGGPARYFAEPTDEAAFLALWEAARRTGTPVLLLGNGSNLLVRDGGFDGLAIRLQKNFSQLQRGETTLCAQAGALLSALSREALSAGLTGLEFAQGIPGTVGGGAYMNAGAYGGELGQVIDQVRVFDGRAVRSLPGQEMEFSYRHTRAMTESWVILSASFRLEKGEPAEIEARMKDFAARRREKQPLEFPSAGSFFKRPAGHFAGALIEQSGLKGLRVGGAQVSEKHAGFLINRGNATAADFIALMEQVQACVLEKFQVRLEPEVRIVGHDA